ncbi:hypothetical protein MMC22_000085 [Lobaria immixta]|nr:hypothetical protein [Lobaria immixta]
MTTSEVLIIRLQATSKLLQLLHHRNKNQHRHAKWWKWLAMLKRCVNKLIQELKASDQTTANFRTSYMKNILIPKCYVPFAQLVKDKQFSALGLAVVGELARTKRTLDALHAERIVSDGLIAIPAANHRSTVDLGFEELMEDVGESIEREPPDSFHSGKLLNVLPVPREIPVAKDLQPNPGPEADLNVVEKSAQPWKTTRTASSDPSRSSGRAKSKARNIHSHIIDRLFQGLA